MKILVPFIIIGIVIVLVADDLVEEAHALPLIFEGWMAEPGPSAFLTLVLATPVSLYSLFPAFVIVADGGISTLVTTTDVHIFDGVAVADDYDADVVTVPNVDVVPTGTRAGSIITLAVPRKVVVPDNVGVGHQTAQGGVNRV